MLNLNESKCWDVFLTFYSPEAIRAGLLRELEEMERFAELRRG